MKKFLIIIVRYKKDLSEILPLKYFEQCQSNDFEYFIYDNSPDKLLSLSLSHAVRYVYDGFNSGVSKAYNEGVKYAVENGFKWVILFDQDTEIRDSNYFSAIKENIYVYKDINLFAPIVYYNKGVMSPKICKYYRPISNIINLGIQSLKNVSIINSGLTISTDSFVKAGGYNELVILDFADYQFIERFQKCYDKFVVVETYLYQDFSNDESDINRLLNRFDIYCKSLNGYKTNFVRRIMLLYTGLLHTFALCKRTRNLSFIQKFIKSQI